MVPRPSHAQKTPAQLFIVCESSALAHPSPSISPSARNEAPHGMRDGKPNGTALENALIASGTCRHVQFGKWSRRVKLGCQPPMEKETEEDATNGAKGIATRSKMMLLGATWEKETQLVLDCFGPKEASLKASWLDNLRLSWEGDS